MLQQAKTEAKKNSRGRRYRDSVLEHFSLSAWVLGGRRFYEILHANIPCTFPSPRRIEEKLANLEVDLAEGELNVVYLKNFLVLNNLPLLVSIAEDATAVIQKREYHSKTNSIVGLGLPLASNGLPDRLVATANSADDIYQAMEKYDRASVIFVVMAQPLADGYPAIRICSFGSNN